MRVKDGPKGYVAKHRWKDRLRKEGKEGKSQAAAFVIVKKAGLVEKQTPSAHPSKMHSQPDDSCWNAADIARCDGHYPTLTEKRASSPLFGCSVKKLSFETAAQSTATANTAT